MKQQGVGILTANQKLKTETKILKNENEKVHKILGNLQKSLITISENQKKLREHYESVLEEKKKRVEELERKLLEQTEDSSKRDTNTREFNSIELEIASRHKSDNKKFSESTPFFVQNMSELGTIQEEGGNFRATTKPKVAEKKGNREKFKGFKVIGEEDGYNDEQEESKAEKKKHEPKRSQKHRKKRAPEYVSTDSDGEIISKTGKTSKKRKKKRFLGVFKKKSKRNSLRVPKPVDTILIQEKKKMLKMGKGKTRQRDKLVVIEGNDNREAIEELEKLGQVMKELDLEKKKKRMMTMKDGMKSSKLSEDELENLKKTIGEEEKKIIENIEKIEKVKKEKKQMDLFYSRKMYPETKACRLI
jgi:hypothetical protein